MDVSKSCIQHNSKTNAVIDNSFDVYVQEIYSAKGPVIVTGIGKSSIIANKIVATRVTVKT